MSNTVTKSVQFRVNGMDVPEFAILRRDANPKKMFGIRIEAGYAVDIGKHVIQPRYKLTLVQDEQPFILLSVIMAFQIKSEGWGRVFDDETNEVLISESLASHFGVLVVGAMRGVLFEKLRRTEYATLVLSTIDISEITKEHRMHIQRENHG